MKCVPNLSDGRRQERSKGLTVEFWCPSPENTKDRAIMLVAQCRLVSESLLLVDTQLIAGCTSKFGISACTGTLKTFQSFRKRQRRFHQLQGSPSISSFEVKNLLCAAFGLKTKHFRKIPICSKEASFYGAAGKTNLTPEDTVCASSDTRMKESVL